MRRRLPWLAGALFLSFWLLSLVYQPSLMQSVWGYTERLLLDLCKDYMDLDLTSCRHLEYNHPFVLILLVVVGLLMVSIFVSLRQSSAFLLLVVGILAILGLVFGFISSQGILFNPAYPLIGWIGLYLSVATVKCLCRIVSSKRMGAIFDRKVSSSVLSYVARHPETLQALKNRHAAIMSSEIAQFQSLVENVPLGRIESMLKRYLDPIARTIRTRKGYLDKIDADRIRAEWGVPFLIENHATQACDAVIDQVEIVRRLQKGFQSDFQFDLRVHYGIDSGRVAAGRIKTDSIHIYTAMGEVIERSDWLKSLSYIYGVQIVVGENAARECGDSFVFRHLDRIARSRRRDAETMEVHELVGRHDDVDPEKMRTINLYQEGLDLYLGGDFPGAIAKLQDALGVDSADGPSRMLIGRVRELKRHPPQEWGGAHVWEMQ